MGKKKRLLVVTALVAMSALIAVGLLTSCCPRKALPDIEPQAVEVTHEVEVTRQVLVEKPVEVTAPPETVVVTVEVAAPITGGIPGEDDGESCVNKLYTYPENSQERVYLFEIQSEQVQMNDWYPQAGVPTILVLEQPISPTQRSDYALGLGSAWAIYEDREGCEGLDPIANAVEHGEARLDQGFSGCVFDNRESHGELVANIGSLSEEQCQTLWEGYIAARVGAEAGSESGALLVGGCEAVRGPDSDAMAEVMAAEGQVWVVEAWGGSLGDAFVVIPAGETVVRSWQGGAVWQYSCPDVESVLRDISGRGRPIYVVEAGELVLVEE